MDQSTRKLVTMNKALHPRDDVDRLYVSRKEGGRGLANIEDSIEDSKTTGTTWRKTDYSHQEQTDHTRINRTTITRKQKWEGKKLYDIFSD